VTPERRLVFFLAGSAVAIALVVLPLLIPTTNPTAGKAQKTHKPEMAITVRGTIQKTTDQDGTTAYTMLSNGTTYRLSHGPEWWWGTNDPLAAYVGRTVEVIGEVTQGSTDLDVQSVDGKALRDAGRPPWAGGPKAVGENHPGSDKNNAKPGASGSPSPSVAPPPSTSPSHSPAPSPS
jgi:hypothetical protein